MPAGLLPQHGVSETWDSVKVTGGSQHTPSTLAERSGHWERVSHAWKCVMGKYGLSSMPGPARKEAADKRKTVSVGAWPEARGRASQRHREARG